jgi:neutral ceramidase
MFTAGICEKVITPDFPSYLTGYPVADRLHTCVHDDLMAHCFYLSDGQTQAAIVTLDLCYYSKRRVQSARKAVEAASGVPAENVMISCTHTHSAPAPAGEPLEVWDDRTEKYPAYLDWVDAQIAQGVQCAKNSAFRAGIAFAKGICGPAQYVGGNRHDPNGEHDEEVSTLLIKDIFGHVRGVLLSYSLHPTFLHAESKVLTADYPCYVYAYCKALYGADTVVGFQNGTSGDQSSRFFRSGQNFDEAKRVGEAIAAAGTAAANRADVDYAPDLRVCHGTFMPELKHYPPYDQAVAVRDAAQAELDRLQAEGAPYPIVRTQECTLIGANKTVMVAKTIAEKGLDGIRTLLPFELMTLVIGKVCVVGVPCELFVRYGLNIKKISPYPYTYVASLTNGASSGYICTPESYEEGGYEALASLFAPGNGEALVEAQKTLFGKLSDAQCG